MANEISVTAMLAYTNTAAGIGILPTWVSLNAYGQLPTLLFSITGKNYVSGSLQASTGGGTTVPVSDLATLGWSMWINQDPTNYAQVVGGSNILAKLPPGAPALFYIDASYSTLTVKCAAGTPLVQFLILEI